MCRAAEPGEANIGEVNRAGTGRPVADGRLLAEAVRYYESAQGVSSGKDDATALEKARALSGSIEAKVLARAGALPVAPNLVQEISRLWSILRGLGLAGIGLAALAGAATARTAFAGAEGTTVNFFWLLASLLGLHALSFTVWLALMIVTPRWTSGGILGSAMLWLWRQLSERFGPSPYRAAAMQALGVRWGRGRTGRWLASSLGHGLWLGFVLGILAMTLALLSAQQYIFVWETTILDATAYVRLTDTLAALPAALGIAVPDRATVIAAQWPGAPDAGNDVLWSALLISTILLYGLLPRALALAVSAWQTRRGAAVPLDLGRPYYAQLVTRLSPMVSAIRVIDRDTEATTPSDTHPDLAQLPPAPAAGPVYLIGWEIDAPEVGWPPPGTPDQVHDLGCRDGRAELDGAIDALTKSANEPSRVAAVLDLRQTPDRGVTAALAALRTAAHGHLVVVFTGAATLHTRMPAPDAATRIADWVAAGLAAGIEADHMLAIDLDRPTADDRRRLAHILGAAAA